MIAILDSVLVSLVAFADPGFHIDLTLGEGMAGGAVGTFLTTLVVGAILVAVAPEYTQRIMAVVVDEPVESVLYGVFVLLALLVVTIALVLTIVGILVAFPLLIVAYVVWAIGATIAYLAIADRLIGREDGWLKPLLLAAALNAVLVLTAIGGFVSVLVGAAGFGAVVRSWIS